MMETLEPNAEPLLRVSHVCTDYTARSGWFGGGGKPRRVVNDVTFDLSVGQTLGLVGESGCGKTTLVRTILRLVTPSRGSIHFDGLDVLHPSRQEKRRLHREVQVVFQDPMGSLNPRMRIGSIVAEPLVIHRVVRGRALNRCVASLLERVGLTASHAQRYPHELSGGQRQRVGIARAMAVKPKLIICDEPVSALDVSIQAQIVNLLDDLQQEHGVAYLFIAHNLAVVRHIAHRVAVMYRGCIVEKAPTDVLFDHPQHAYTKTLLNAVPDLDPRGRLPRIRRNVLS